ncbi:protein takeout-like [Ostrinia nubilalis]|uniref:protein takeout-like n=1 Tax=Ostrinia nubilalis TaxID=29057 RepID=UPI00308224CA
MSKIVFSFLILAAIVDNGFSNAVSSLTKCKAVDSACIQKSSQVMIPIFANGIPELGVEQLDPLTYKGTIDTSTSGLKLLLSNLTFTGLKDCVMKKIQRDVVKSNLEGQVLCDVDVNGHYEMNGKLLILTVRGQGKTHVFLRKILINFDATLSDKVKDGKSYWDIKKFTHSYELEDKADVEFENLFTGSDVLGRAASQVIENSGNEIVIEVGPPVVKTLVTRVIANVKKFFNHVPPEDLSID